MEDEQNPLRRLIAVVGVGYGAALLLGLLALAFSSCSGIALAQWGRGSCAPAGPVGSTFRSSPYQPVQSLTQTVAAREWRQVAVDPGRWHLFVGGQQSGAFCPASGQWRAYDPLSGIWSPASPPPADLPRDAHLAAGWCRCSPECLCRGDCVCEHTQPCAEHCACGDVVTDTGGGGDLPAFELQEELIADGAPHPTGVVQSELHRSGEQIWQGLHRATMRQAVEAIEAVPEYGRKPRIVVTGRDREKTVTDLHGLGFREKFLLHEYPPDHWHLRDRDGRPAFHVDGAPTLYVQGPDGGVIHRSDRPLSAEDLAALRKADPNYNPAKDPDLTKPKPSPAPGPSPLPFDPAKIPSGAWVLGVGLILFLILHRRPQQA